jgi:hypothetical protein
MTDHVARLYAGALALLVFFVVWAVVAARPWAEAGASDPRMAALERREQRLVRASRRVNEVVQRRFATYRRRLARRRKEIAAAEAAAAAAAAAPVSAAPATSSSVVAAPSATTPSATATSAPAPAAPAPLAPPPVAVTAAPPVTSTGSS